MRFGAKIALIWQRCAIYKYKVVISNGNLLETLCDISGIRIAFHHCVYFDGFLNAATQRKRLVRLHTAFRTPYLCLSLIPLIYFTTLVFDI